MEWGRTALRCSIGLDCAKQQYFRHPRAEGRMTHHNLPGTGLRPTVSLCGHLFLFPQLICCHFRHLSSSHRCLGSLIMLIPSENLLCPPNPVDHLCRDRLVSKVASKSYEFFLARTASYSNPALSTTRMFSAASMTFMPTKVEVFPLIRKIL